MIILDIDNCIADDRWRIPRIEWQFSDPNRRYHAYHSLAPWDEPGNRDLFAGRTSGIAIFTARPTLYNAATREWLARAGVRWTHLLMRNTTDHSHSIDLKAKQLQWLLSEYGVKHSEIEAAYDDRPDVVEMYRAAGLRAEVRAIHDVCAYTPPPIKEKIS